MDKFWNNCAPLEEKSKKIVSRIIESSPTITRGKPIQGEKIFGIFSEEFVCITFAIPSQSENAISA